MKQKQDKERWFKVPFVLFDLDLNCYEITVLLFIISKIDGYGKSSDRISYSQIVKNTKISKDKVLKVIKELEAKGLITVKKQSLENGSKDINKYSLALVRPTVKGSLYGGQGGSTPHGHTLEYIKERENSIFFIIDKQNQGFLVNEYIKYIKANSSNIKNLIAYSNKIKSNIAKEDKETINGLLEWINTELKIEIQKDNKILQGIYNCNEEIFFSNYKGYTLKIDRFIELFKENKIKLIQ